MGVILFGIAYSADDDRDGAGSFVNDGDGDFLFPPKWWVLMDEERRGGFDRCGGKTVVVILCGIAQSADDERDGDDDGDGELVKESVGVSCSCWVLVITTLTMVPSSATVGFTSSSEMG